MNIIIEPNSCLLQPGCSRQGCHAPRPPRHGRPHFHHTFHASPEGYVTKEIAEHVIKIASNKRFFLYADVIQDLYLKELKNYKPAPVVRISPNVHTLVAYGPGI
jgi:hypothetical protein